MLTRAKESNLNELFITDDEKGKIIIGLAGNPNTGKSTLFNYLTGLKQHTGNWPGKTVANAKGYFSYEDLDYLLVDLPGTYSLFINSQEEEIARDFICFGNPKVTIVVVDGTNLERNLNLSLQVMEAADNVIICVNLMDEAEKKGIEIQIDRLKELLQVPVIPIVARDGIGVRNLLKTIDEISRGELSISPKRIPYDDGIEGLIGEIENILYPHINEGYNLRWIALRLMDGDQNMKKEIKKVLLKNNNYEPLFEIETLLNKHHNTGEKIVSSLYMKAETIADEVVKVNVEKHKNWDAKLDNILTSKFTGYPIMLLLLGLIFWITIAGANYPSDLLGKLLFGLEPKISKALLLLNPPLWLHDMLVLGVYRTLAWVVSVMLPPMAIFFPLFTLLEDLGYLPRIAFNLDNFF